MYIEPLMRSFGASEAVLPEAKDYAFWMFIAALANLPAQCLNCAARAESSAKISSAAVITGALLNVILDPVFMFSWGLDMGVEGASLATTISQFVTLIILVVFYFGGCSAISISLKRFSLSITTLRSVMSVGVPSAVIQICLSLASSATNIAVKVLPDADYIIAAYGVVQRLVLIGSYMIMGFMQGYQPAASYMFGAGDKRRFRECVMFALKGTLILSFVISLVCIVCSHELIMLFNKNPVVIDYGFNLLISQVILFMSFGLSYMMTITFQTLGKEKLGLLLSVMRQGVFYLIMIQTLPKLWGIRGVYLSQPLADVLTVAASYIVYVKCND